MTISLKDKKIAVLGAGADGLVMAQALFQRGAKVTLWGVEHSGRRKGIEQAFQNSDVILHLDSTSEIDFENFDYVVETPGSGQFKNFLAKQNQEKIFSDLDFICQWIQAPIIAVTGTNGKSSTLAFIAHMLQKQGYKLGMYGGEYRYWGELLLEEEKKDYYLFELSSKRLEMSSRFHPQIALLLNIFPAHLNRHEGGLESYIHAKAKIFQHQNKKDYLIYNGDASNVSHLLQQKSASSKLCPFSLETEITGPCVFLKDHEMQWQGFAGELEKYKLPSFRVSPVHLLNLMAALWVAKLCQVKPEYIQEVVSEASSIPHRMQVVRVIGKVPFIDDSKASNIAATAWALSSYQTPIFWIVGEDLAESQEVENLLTLIKGQIKTVIIFGKQANRLENKLKHQLPVVTLANLKEAVEWANHKAEVGDVVIYSPAISLKTASLKGDEAQGEDFQKWVLLLPEFTRMTTAKSQPIRF